MTLARLLVLAPINAYRRLVSPLIPSRCRYYPTCSNYAVEAIDVHGAARGMVLAGWRLLRCNPLSSGGIDRVQDQRLFGPQRIEPTPR